MTELTRTPFNPRVEMIDGTPILIKSETGEYERLEYLLKSPTRVYLKETLTNFDSFLETVKDRFDNAQATVYARSFEQDKYCDFSFEGVALDCRTGFQWRDDCVIKWQGKHTISAREWLKYDEKPMSQEDFALFLDKHLDDVYTSKIDDDMQFSGYPTKAELYNFVTTLEDSKGQKFSRKINVQNGDMSVSLVRESDDGTKERLKLFERFAINLKIYEGFPTYRVNVKLRFRIKDGQVIFFYDIEGLEELFNENRDWAVEKIRELGFKVCI